LLQRIKQILFSRKGIPLPHAADPVSGEASFRLLTAYLSFVLAFISIVALHIFSQVLVATGVAVAFFALNMVFYMLKRLTRAKFDLDDQSIDLGDGDDAAPVTKNGTPAAKVDNPD
jgi:hypothetical protein